MINRDTEMQETQAKMAGAKRKKSGGARGPVLRLGLLAGRALGRLPFGAMKTLALPAALALALVLSGFGTFARTCAAVRGSTLRLHVVAATDSEEDQALKLAVRDEILAAFGDVFADADGLAGAKAAARERLPEIEAAARRALEKQGCADGVRAALSREYFGTTKYGALTMPAGQYDALRVEIGAAAGHNWWCVLYPPLCVPAACGALNMYTEEEAALVEGGYEIRFAALEWLEWAKNRVAPPEEAPAP